MRAAILFFLIATAVAVAAIEAAAYVALHRQDFAWTRLDLDDPVGRATGTKLAALGRDGRQCARLLADVGDADQPAPAVAAGAGCGFADGMRLRPEDDRSIAFHPAGVVASCPVAAALVLWERDIVQPAAARHFGSPVATIHHAGSYACRRLYGRAEGGFSEHATANAFDVIGFTLADGRMVSIQRDWPRNGAEGAFLRDARDGACKLFATVLSPDYNAAHADHLHLDQAQRRGGWRMCR
ncbi:MAG TPA: extensin family protein [Sphingomicrobium sp.]|nr:extensin family protein [Sphingomicrobium sp.]